MDMAEALRAATVLRTAPSGPASQRVAEECLRGAILALAAAGEGDGNAAAEVSICLRASLLASKPSARAAAASPASRAARRLAWCAGDRLAALATALGASSKTYGSQARQMSENEDAELARAAKASWLTDLLRLALLRACVEANARLSRAGRRSIIMDEDSLMRVSSTGARDPVRAAVALLAESDCRADPIVHEEAERVVSAVAKALEQLALCSGAIGMLICSEADLCRLLGPFLRFAWLFRKPWQVARDSLETALEFMMQDADKLGLQGAKICELLLTDLSRDKLESDFLQGSYTSMLRASSELVKIRGLRSPQVFLRLARIIIKASVDLSLERDPRDSSLRYHKQTNASTFLSFRSRRAAQLHTLHPSEKAFVDVVAELALNLFNRYVLEPSKELDNLVRVIFARIGRSDVHWKTIIAKSSLDLKTTEVGLSKYEATAALLRSANGILNEDIDDYEFRGVLAALHEIASADMQSIQAQVEQARRYNLKAVESGEYTIGVFAARLLALILDHVIQVQTFSFGPDSLSQSTESVISKLLVSLSGRASAARAVHGLSIDIVLAWIPAIALGAGHSHGEISDAAAHSFSNILKTVAMRETLVSESADIAQERGRELNSLILRFLEIVHSVFAQGRIPIWITDQNEGKKSVVIMDPVFSDYSKDLMLLLTRKEYKSPTLKTFKISVLLKTIQTIKKALDAELRTSLLPFQNFPSNFMHSEEVRPYAIAGEILIPRVEILYAAITDFNTLWEWRRNREVGRSDAILRLASVDGALLKTSQKRSSLGGGALSLKLKAAESIALCFATFDCLRGRISSAFYFHVAAQILLDARDDWEAGNAFFRVAKCIIGKPYDDFGTSADSESLSRDELHMSIASLFLREARQLFDGLGAIKENQAVLELQALISLNENESTDSNRIPFVPQQTNEQAVAFYFLVGRVKGPSLRHERKASDLIGDLFVARMVLRPTPKVGVSKVIEAMESTLVERVQSMSGLSFVDGLLSFEEAETWTKAETETLRRSDLRVQPKFESAGNSSVESFWVRQLWPVQIGSCETEPIVWCPHEFVIMQHGEDKSFREVFVRTLQSLTPLCALASCEVVPFPPSQRLNYDQLLCSSVYGNPFPEIKSSEDKSKLEGKVIEVADDEEVPRPPSYPPPDVDHDENMDESAGNVEKKASKDGSQREEVENESGEERLPLIPPKSSAFLVGAENESKETLDDNSNREFLNPMLNGEGKAKVDEVSYKHGIPVRMLVGGEMLEEEDAERVKELVSAQEAWFEGKMIDKSGLKEVQLRLFGRPPETTGVYNGNGVRSRRPSFFATLRKPSDAGIEKQKEFYMQIWSGNGVVLVKRKSRSFRVIHEYSLDTVAFARSTAPGVVKIIVEEREKRGEDPIFFQSSSAPEIVIATQKLL